MKTFFKVEAKLAQIQKLLPKKDRVSDDRVKVQPHLETNLHRLSSPENILNFSKSNAKLHFFGPFSRSVRTLIIKIFSSELPTHTKNIHSDRKVCNFVTFFHLSCQDLFQTVDRPFKSPRAARSK